MALDLMLRSLLNSTEFQSLKDKNWSGIAKLVPGTTAKQCECRYDELINEPAASQVPGQQVGFIRNGVPLPVRSARSDEINDQRSSRPSSAKQKALKAESSEPAIQPYSLRPLSADQGPTMVIHVCDEAKNVKQDFHCPRDLLIKEMKYFAEYLSTDAQRWEEVDISVHCDVQIFDWLMKYVKRGTKEVPVAPKLEPTNVISILISSDFLKMETLVGECVTYCHGNMNSIIATPCNMNCINDKLVTRIANLFTHNEADEIRDRKDKFKSKLFSKKLEKLFDPLTEDSCSPEKATTLHRCSVCKKLMTDSLEKKLKCHNIRMSISKSGQLTYTHLPDPTWDINEYVIDLKTQLKSWRDVYWRVWGVINYLTCSRCGETFPCSELGHCQYHPEQPLFDTVSKDLTKCAVGHFPCCNQKTYRFDPTKQEKGCKVRDHVVTLTAQPPQNKDSQQQEGDSVSTSTSQSSQHVYEDLLLHRDAICVPYQRLISHTEQEVQENVFQQEEQACGVNFCSFPLVSESAPTDQTSKAEVLNKPRLQALTVEVMEDEFGESDDEVGDEEESRGRSKRIIRKSRVTVDPKAILLDAPDFSTTKSHKWDSSRSVRWNQDAQREEDQRRMNDMVGYLTRLRLHSEKHEKARQREPMGGLFCKLENQWKSVYIPSLKNNMPQSRGKTRHAPIKS